MWRCVLLRFTACVAKRRCMRRRVPFPHRPLPCLQHWHLVKATYSALCSNRRQQSEEQKQTLRRISPAETLAVRQAASGASSARVSRRLRASCCSSSGAKSGASGAAKHLRQVNQLRSTRRLQRSCKVQLSRRTFRQPMVSSTHLSFSGWEAHNALQGARGAHLRSCWNRFPQAAYHKHSPVLSRRARRL